MRVVCLSDTHGNVDLEVPEGDLLIHTGDHSKRGSPQELEQAARWLRSLPHPHKVILAGNHDFALQISEDETRELFSPMTYLQDQEVTIEGLRIYGSPWTPTFGGVWAFQSSDLASVWEKIPDGIDILLTHGPPARILDRTFARERAGCPMLAERVASVRPKLHVFGHIHEAFGVERQGETLFVNASNSAIGYVYPQPVHVLDWDGQAFTQVTAWTAAEPLWAFLVDRWGEPIDLRDVTEDQLQATEYLGQVFWLDSSAWPLRFYDRSRLANPASAVPLTFGVKISRGWLDILNTNRWSSLP